MTQQIDKIGLNDTNNIMLTIRCMTTEIGHFKLN